MTTTTTTRTATTRTATRSHGTQFAVVRVFLWLVLLSLLSSSNTARVRATAASVVVAAAATAATEKKDAVHVDNVDNDVHHVHDDDSKALSSVRYPSLLICTLIDGSVVSLDSDSGALSSYFQTGRDLVSTQTQSHDNDHDNDNNNHHPPHDDNNDGNTPLRHHTTTRALVVPDLDGNLYQTRTMQELGVTVDEILQAPVQTCVESHVPGQPPLCGIVTGAKLTSLYGMDASSGKLVWSSHSSTTTTTASTTSTSNTKSSSSSSSKNIVILQREDYFVQHLSALTGHQVWNVTLGRFSAPNFGLSSDSSPSAELHSTSTTATTTTTTTSNLMIDNDGIQDNDDPLFTASSTTTTTTSAPLSLMPLVSFDDQGRMLTVLDQKTRQVQWRRQLPHVIARVYGLRDGMWVPLTIVDEEEGEEHGGGDDTNNDDDDGGTNTHDDYEHHTRDSRVQQLFLPQSKQDDEIYHLLLKQHQLQQSSQWTDTSIGLYYPPLLPNERARYRPDEAQQRQQETGVETESSRQTDPQTHVHITSDQGGNFDVRESPADIYSTTCHQPGTSVYEPAFVAVPSVQHPHVFVQAFPPELRPSGGLFLTWPILAGIVMTAMAGALGLVYIYLNKKQKWLMQAAASTPLISHRRPTPALSPPPLELERHLSVPLEDHADRSFCSAPHVVTRSLSMPVIRGDKSPNDLNTIGNRSIDSVSPGDVMSLPQRSVITSTTDPSTMPLLKQVSPMLRAEPNSLEGIPLVRYSRYRSEFKELSPLGKGGFGSVFECQNLLDGRKYAIKKVPIQLFDDPQLTRDRLQRVLREVKILALLDHPNIVRYYTAWMEVEESTDESQDMATGNGGDDDFTSSKFLSRCYSSSLLLTTMSNHLLEHDRPSQMMGNRRKKTPKPPPQSHQNSANPLGSWNAFADDISQFSLEKRRGSVESLSEYGFHFERADRSESSQPPIGDSKDDSSSIREDCKARKIVQFDVTPQQRQSSEDDVSSSCSSNEGSFGTLSEKSELKGSGTVTPTEPRLRHILYIQMQLCGQKTLANFLSNQKARRTPDGTEVDIHYALKLFHHVAMGVKYVHSQDLIHRDLKPNNCFMDDSGIVKVGDFGLSRETNNDLDISSNDEDEGSMHEDGEENTAGVGTRAYASPEQINGSDYDNSTDIYSLGFILFELTFQMSTGMERHIMFSRLRQGTIPEEWATKVAGSFPILHSMLSAMLSPTPAERPSADDVVRMMDKLLGEFTIQSLDQSLQDQSSMLLLRVEAEPSDHVLIRTMQLIKDSAPGVKIDQYGLRSGGESSTIIEFALSGTDQAGLTRVLTAMKACPGIKVARQVASKGKVNRELSYSAATSSECASEE